MTRIGNLILSCFLLMTLWSSSAATENSLDQPAIACNRGPIFRNFGGTWWFVYACTDNESLALVSLPYNPACPYHFVISKAEDGRYTVNGFGNDAEKTIPVVKNELGQLTATEISSLIIEIAGVAR